MIELKLGDIFKCDEDIMMHGCNCFHGIDAGVASIVWELFPEARERSIKHHEEGDFSALGTFVATKVDNTTIINAYTQYYGGANFDINAFIHILKSINIAYKGQSIAIPKIGAGIGGANWEDVEIAILKYAPQVNWKVYVYV